MMLRSLQLPLQVLLFLIGCQLTTAREYATFAIVESPIETGKSCVFEDYSFTRKNNKLKDGVHVRKRALILSGNTLGNNCEIGENSRIFEICELHDGVTVEDNVQIGPKANLLPNVKVLSNAKIRARATVGQKSIIGKYTVVDIYAIVKEMVFVGEASYISSFCEIGARSIVHVGAELSPGHIYGDDSVIVQAPTTFLLVTILYPYHRVLPYIGQGGLGFSFKEDFREHSKEILKDISVEINNNNNIGALKNKLHEYIASWVNIYLHHRYRNRLLTEFIKIHPNIYYQNMDLRKEEHDLFEYGYIINTTFKKLIAIYYEINRDDSHRIGLHDNFINNVLRIIKDEAKVNFTSNPRYLPWYDPVNKETGHDNRYRDLNHLDEIQYYFNIRRKKFLEKKEQKKREAEAQRAASRRKPTTSPVQYEVALPPYTPPKASPALPKYSTLPEQQQSFGSTPIISAYPIEKTERRTSTDRIPIQTSQDYAPPVRQRTMSNPLTERPPTYR